MQDILRFPVKKHARVGETARRKSAKVKAVLSRFQTPPKRKKRKLLDRIPIPGACPACVHRPMRRSMNQRGLAA